MARADASPPRPEHRRPRSPLPAHRRRRGPGPARRPLEDAARHGRARPRRHVLRRRHPPAHLRQPVTLGSLGINIRGRSSRLTLSYRTTRQILACPGLLSDETTTTSTAAPRTSPATGPCSREPTACMASARRRRSGWGVAQPPRGSSPAPPELAVCLPTKEMVSRVLDAFKAAGGTRPGPLTAPSAPAACVSARCTGSRAWSTSGWSSPGCRTSACHGPASTGRTRTPPVPAGARRDRSLLFVAATRARDDLAIYWDGDPSPFLPAPPS